MPLPSTDIASYQRGTLSLRRRDANRGWRFAGWRKTTSAVILLLLVVGMLSLMSRSTPTLSTLSRQDGGALQGERVPLWGSSKKKAKKMSKAEKKAAKNKAKEAKEKKKKAEEEKKNADEAKKKEEKEAKKADIKDTKKEEPPAEPPAAVFDWKKCIGSPDPQCWAKETARVKALAEPNATIVPTTTPSAAPSMSPASFDWKKCISSPDPLCWAKETARVKALTSASPSGTPSSAPIVETGVASLMTDAPTVMPTTMTPIMSTTIVPTNVPSSTLTTLAPVAKPSNAPSTLTPTVAPTVVVPPTASPARVGQPFRLLEIRHTCPRPNP